MAVNGSNLIILVIETRQRLSIHSSGEIAPSKTQAVPPESFPCPALAAFKGSGYNQCRKLRDQRTGRPRLLAYEGPCT